MGCGCKKKTPGVTVLQSSIHYDFESDPDFILVEYLSQYMKKVRTFFNVTTFYNTYGMASYGIQSKGSRFLIHIDDYNYYKTHSVSGIELQEIVEPEVLEAVQLEVSDFTKLTGVGAATQDKLYELGYKTYNDLLMLDKEAWSEISNANYDRMRESLKEYTNA